VGGAGCSSSGCGSRGSPLGAGADVGSGSSVGISASRGVEEGEPGRGGDLVSAVGEATMGTVGGAGGMAYNAKAMRSNQHSIPKVIVGTGRQGLKFLVATEKEAQIHAVYKALRTKATRPISVISRDTRDTDTAHPMVTW